MIREDGLAVNCVHCATWIEKGSQYEVQLFYQEDTNYENPIGPFCEECFSLARACSICGNVHVKGHGVDYRENGEWICDKCMEHIISCPDCGAFTDQLHPEFGVCNNCFQRDYFLCKNCKKYHKYTEDGRSSMLDDVNVKSYNSLFSKYSTSICFECYSILKKKYKKRSAYRCKRCNGVYFGSQKYCGHCTPFVARCSVCNEESHIIKYLMYNRSYQPICVDCREALKSCSICNTLTESKNIKKVKYKLTTSQTCTFCHEEKKMDRSGECRKCLKVYRDLNEDRLCETCSSLEKEKCPKCGRTVSSDGHCKVCRPSVDRYHHRFPILFQYNNGDDGIFMGFENEMVYKVQDDSDEHFSSTISSLLSCFGTDILQLQRDSSIHGQGFEVISQPHTLKSFMAKDWSPLFINMTSDPESCGLHVHISNNSFSGSSHLYKFTNWIHSNEDFCNKVARRNYGTYNRKIRKKVSEAVKESYNGDYDRYQRINMRGIKEERGTVEVRMFSGAKNLMQLLGSIQFCHALVTFTRDVSMKDTSVSSFLSFVGKKKEYKEFLELWNSVKA